MSPILQGHHITLMSDYITAIEQACHKINIKEAGELGWTSIEF